MIIHLLSPDKAFSVNMNFTDLKTNGTEFDMLLHVNSDRFTSKSLAFLIENWKHINPWVLFFYQNSNIQLSLLMITTFMLAEIGKDATK